MKNYISLGGAGGCGIALYLRKLEQPAYPFDWLYCTQSFIINSFFDKSKFIDWNKRDSNNYGVYFNNTIEAAAIHDNLSNIDNIIIKYNRRFARLYLKLEDKKESLVFIRLMINTNNIAYTKYNDQIYEYKNNVDSLDDWIEFIRNLNHKYNRNNIYLILMDETINDAIKINNNIIRCPAYNWDIILSII